MIINRNFKDFKFRHRSNKNQIIYTSKKVKNDDEVINLIDNFLIEKNSFIFESVEKGKIKGRYTIFGRNPDKIWEFNNNNSYLIKDKKKIKLKDKPDQLIQFIYLVKLVSSKKNTFNETDENYLNFVNNQNTNTRKSILQSYDQLLNSKYQVQLNQKTIDRVKNYFK